MLSILPTLHIDSFTKVSYAVILYIYAVLSSLILPHLQTPKDDLKSISVARAQKYVHRDSILGTQ